MSVATKLGTEDITVLDVQEHYEWDGDRGRFRYCVARADTRSRGNSRGTWFTHDELNEDERNILFALAVGKDMINVHTRKFNGYRERKKRQLASVMDARYTPCETPHAVKYHHRLSVKAPRKQRSSWVPPPNPTPDPIYEQQFAVGDKIRAMDYEGFWYDAHVVHVRDDSVKVHFHGWKSRYDEWITLDTGRLSKEPPPPPPLPPARPPAPDPSDPPRRSWDLNNSDSSDYEDDVEDLIIAESTMPIPN